MQIKPVLTGLASFGMSGQVFHAPFIAANPGFKLAAVVERSKKIMGQRYPGVRSVDSFAQLLEIEDIELIVVNTPDVTHYEFVKAALTAGKHVVVEKPFVYTVAEARELTELAQQRGLMLTVFQNRRFDGDFMTVRKIVETGVLGRVVEYNAAFERFREVNPESWKDTAEGRVGLLYNLGSHSVDQALVLFGRPQKVRATMDVVRQGGRVCDYFSIGLDYDRLHVNLRASMCVREPGANFTVHGTVGSYTVSQVDPQEEALKLNKLPSQEGWGEVPSEKWGILNTPAGRAPYPTIAGDYGLYYANIYDCLRNGAQPEVTHEQMIDLISVLEDCYDQNNLKL